MNFAKRALLFLATALFGTFLFSLVATATFTQTAAKPEKLKGWLVESDVYNRLVPAMMEKLQKDAAERPPAEQATAGREDSIDFNRPEVQAIVQRALTPQFIQTSTEQVIDSVYRWLNGDVKKPDFAINTGEIKTRIATEVGNYLRQRAATLPVCRTVPQQTNLFDAECIPRGTNVEAEIQKVVDEVNGSDEFLAEETLTADNLGKDTGASEQSSSFFSETNGLPGIYRLMLWLPIVFGVLALLSAAGIIFLNEERRKGLGRVMTTLLITGILLLASVTLINLGFNAAKSKVLADNTGTKTAALRDGALKGLDAAKNDIIRVPFVFAAVFLAFGAGIAVYLIMTRNNAARSGEEQAHFKKETKKPDEPNSPSRPAKNS